MSPSRRVFLQQTSLLSASSVIFPLLSESARDPLSSARPLRFGVIADVHKDVMHDADQRLAAFVERATEAKVDFIIQMGDFCVPKAENQGFMDIWRRWKGPNYHVIGNHDTDGGYSREQTVAYYNMPSRYYSFEEGDFHFVVLDGNDRPADHVSGYPCYINAEQQAWLKEDLSATTRPTLVMVHQSLERPEDGGVQNGEAVRRILEANQEAGFQRCSLAFPATTTATISVTFKVLLIPNSIVLPTIGWEAITSMCATARKSMQLIPGSNTRCPTAIRSLPSSPSIQLAES